MGFSAGIEATRACNFRCVHCFVDAGRRPAGELTGAEVKTLIRELIEAGADAIGWSGGEPLLRKDLDELTAFATKLGAQVGLPTNGYFASRQRLESLARSGLSTLQVSLDGPDRARAERYRLGPKDAFERAVAAIEEGARQGLQVTVCTLFSPETAPEIEEMLALAKKLGTRTLRYTPWSPFGRAKGARYDERPWKQASVRRFLEVAEARADAPAGEVDVILDCPIGPRPGRPTTSCGAGRKVLYVCANGDVYPCTALMVPEYRVGNVRDRPIADLLRAPAMFKVQRELLAELPKGRCRRCPAVETCLGGCPGRTLSATGDVRGESPACLYRLHSKSTSR
ncbi:MAG: radical SAM protein [Myxococcales bacterium]